MLSEEEINALNRDLAISHAIHTIIAIGLAETMKEIDRQKDPHVRAYFRSLVDDSIIFMKEQKISYNQ